MKHHKHEAHSSKMHEHHHKHHEGHHKHEGHKHAGHHEHHMKDGHHAHHSHRGSHTVSAGTSERPGHPMGHGDFANMPQHPMFHPYPKERSGDKHLDDTIRRLDGDSVDAEKKVRKNMSKGMY